MGEVAPKMSRQPSLPIPIGAHIHTQLQDTWINFEKRKNGNPKTKKIQNFFWEQNFLVWKRN